MSRLLVITLTVFLLIPSLGMAVGFDGHPKSSPAENPADLEKGATNEALAPCLWFPGQPYKMHFPQLPDEQGWDVNATHPMVLAEDWQSPETGWVKDLHFWGSWMHGNIGLIRSFTLSIHEDIPVSAVNPYSKPGALLWEKEIFQFDQTMINGQFPEGWYDPSTGTIFPLDHTQYFQYDVCLDPPDWFWQTSGTIYWLNISANLAVPDQTAWGWKSSLEHFMDDAVWAKPPTPTCVVPDNGSGTADLPADCPFTSTATMDIMNGLPPGSTLQSKPNLNSFFDIFVTPGGSLGGESEKFQGILQLDMTGTGGLTGYTRSFLLPTVQLQIDQAPRFPGTTPQSMASDLFTLQGQLPPGDPDFDLLRISAGTGFGMPSPGHTTLTRQMGGSWAVESFFDITYRIDFVGASGGPFAGMSGSTTGTIRMTQGSPSPLACIVPDNGGGTADLPADCPISSTATMDIMNGLPPGSTLQSKPNLSSFFNVVVTPGGSLGGESEQFKGMLQLDMAGTGGLTGYTRSFLLPTVQLQIDQAPRFPGTTPQSMASDLFMLQGQLPPGDPDFDLLRISAGTGFGMPSPGHTTLTRQLDGNWAVESFFDITYRIDFIGAPGGPFAGMSGSTTGTIRMTQGSPGDPSTPEWIDIRIPPDFQASMDLSLVVTGGGCCTIPGDANGDGIVNVGDAVYIIGYIFRGGPAPPCLDQANANCDAAVNVGDAVYLITYIFRGGPAPCCP